jgi:aspartate/methionine/tyrosine aminotransferase
MRAVYDRRRKLMVELMREGGFGIPVMPQETFHVLVDGFRRTDDSCHFAFELLEKAGVGVAPGVDFGQAGKRAGRWCYASSEENAPTSRHGLALTEPAGEISMFGICKRARIAR